MSDQGRHISMTNGKRILIIPSSAHRGAGFAVTRLQATGDTIAFHPIVIPMAAVPPG